MHCGGGVGVWGFMAVFCAGVHEVVVHYCVMGSALDLSTTRCHYIISLHESMPGLGTLCLYLLSVLLILYTCTVRTYSEPLYKGHSELRTPL